MHPILQVGESVYCSVNAARRALYRNGLLRPRRLPRPVVSVGNISVGGAGKTPTVITIASALISRGWKTTVLTRGYRSASSVQQAIVDEHDPGRFGDEPVLMWQALRDADIVVGKDRFRSARWYLDRRDCDLFLLDDGFQHLQLHRDIDVVIDDQGATLNRERRSALKGADFLLRRSTTTVDFQPEGSEFAAALRPVVVRWHRATQPLDILHDRKVVAFSGLARNDRFREMLVNLGALVLEFVEFADHHRYTREEVEGLQKRKENAGADLLITTEKDWVKLGADDIAALAVQMEISPREEFFARFFARLESSGASPEKKNDREHDSV